MTTIHKKTGAVFCALAIILWCMAGVLMNSYAGENTGSLTLWCVKNGDVVSGMQWHLYRVGHRENDDYVLEGDFAGYRPTLGDESRPITDWDSDSAASAAEALKLKAIADNIPSRADGITSSAGSVTFKDLENGLYMVWGNVLRVGDTTYIPSAIFFEMNGEDAAVLNAYPKIVMRTQSSDTVRYSVQKVWLNDEDQPWRRSASITVDIYRDNVFYEEVQLSESNDWSYQWEDSSGYTWSVYEKEILENYTVAYEDNSTKYLIVNTYDGPPGGRSETTTTVTTSPTATGSETTTVTAVQTDTDTTAATTRQITGQKSTGTTAQATRTAAAKTTTIAAETKAPQTGQLWWPVPVLALGGMLMLGVGLRLTKKDDN